MQKILSAKQIRNADAYTIKNEHISSVDLMERAATECYKWICVNLPDKKLVDIVCGTGNNGGDGLALARMLCKGREVAVFVLDSEKRSPDYVANLERLQKCDNVRISFLTANDALSLPHNTDLLIDAVFGTGLTRIAEGRYAEAINTMNRQRCKHLSIDMPSGLFVDAHTPDGAPVFEADTTLSFQMAKLAFMMPENYRYVGDFVVLPIGLSPEFIKKEETPYFLADTVTTPSFLCHRPKFSHKGTFGHALLVAGSYGKMGAAILSAKASLRTGAGLLTVHLPKRGVECMQTAFPEAMVSVDAHNEVFSAPPSDLERYNVVAVGPGIGTDTKTIEALGQLLNNYSAPMVIDADAINCLAKEKSLIDIVPQRSVLTPHHKEFERLAGEWGDDFERLDKQKTFSKRHGVIVVFKGAHTTISLPDGRVFFNTTGNPGMATAGSGDVLTGIIAGLLAQGLAPEDAAICGVFLHGVAGDKVFAEKGNGLIASDLVENIAAAVMQMGTNEF